MLSEEEKVLVSLRDITEHSGILNELQVMHLTYWSAISLDDLKYRPEFQYLFEKKTLVIDFKRKSIKTWMDSVKDFFTFTSKRNKRFLILCKNINWLLGTVKVVIKIDGIVAYSYKGEEVDDEQSNS